MMQGFRILFFVLSLLGPAFYASCEDSSVAQIVSTSCLFSPDQKRVLLTFCLGIQDGWYVQGAGSRFSEGPRFQLLSPEHSPLPTPRTYEIVWPTPVWMLKDGFHIPMYQKRMIVPLQLAFEAPAEQAIFQGIFFLFACKDSQCRLLEVPISYKIHVSGQVEPWAAEKAPPSSESLWWILLLAFLGGCILNVMPCVLPILGVKLLAFTQRRCPKGFLVVRDLWASVFGIVAAFVVLAGSVTLFKFFGSKVGWGFHFQNPYFSSIMAAMLLIFIGNMWGVFEFKILGLFQQRIGLCMHTTRAFLTGVLSVFVATPCTAPFVGTAVGFALSRDTSDIWAVFLMMAAGFASPYWIAALLPSHHIRLPKPGAWMVWMQGVITVFMLGALLWFFFLLSGGVNAWYMWILIVLAGMVLLGFFFWSRHIRYAKWMVAISVVGIILAPTWRVFFIAPPERSSSLDVSRVVWKDFQPDHIAKLVRRGHVVFVDVTARWCLTCQVNKHSVLTTPHIESLLRNPSIVCMRGDWTYADKRIAPFLKTFGRAGIPFNVVFGPGAPGGIMLPEILTKDAVRKALKRAAGKE